jgi:hypothetical protein
MDEVLGSARWAIRAARIRTPCPNILFKEINLVSSFRINLRYQQWNMQSPVVTVNGQQRKQESLKVI